MTCPCAARLNDHEIEEINLDRKSIRYILKRSYRARHARIEVRAETGLTVVIPFSYPHSRATEIITAKQVWVLAKLALFNRDKQKFYSGGHCVFYLGHELKVSRAINVSFKDVALAGSDKLMLYLKPGSDPAAAVECWLKGQAEIVIKELAQKWSAALGVKYRALSLRSARTRWGSCSPRGTLSFNWKLIMAPLPVIEYVVVHELCHLTELNHSPSFWKLVEKSCPDWRLHRKWLRANEVALAL